MKRTHILAIMVIALAIGVVMTTAGDASVYVDFREAENRAAEGSTSQVHVVGELKKDAMGNIIGMHYDAVKDPNYFSFLMIDTLSAERQVIYFNPKPQDFERSEKIVITGRMELD